MVMVDGVVGCGLVWMAVLILMVWGIGLDGGGAGWVWKRMGDGRVLRRESDGAWNGFQYLLFLSLSFFLA